MTTNDFDPTTNRIPFGLLNEVEQEELINWPHGWEFYNFHNDRFEAILSNRAWYNKTIYRAKTAPVVTSVRFSVYPKGPSPLRLREDADLFANKDRIAVLRIDTCKGVSTAHLEEI